MSEFASSSTVAGNPDAPLPHGSKSYTPLLLQAGIAIAVTLLVVRLWFLIPIPLLPVAIPVAGLFLLVAIKWPGPVAVAGLFMLYFKVDEITPELGFLYPAVSGMALLLCGLFGWHLFISNRAKLELGGPTKYLFFLWLWLSVGVFFAYSRSAAVEGWKDYSKVLLLMLVMMAFIRTKAHVRAIPPLFVLGGILLSLVAIYNYRSGLFLVEGTRVGIGMGSLSNPNDLALIMLQPLSFVLVYAWSAERWPIRLAALGAASMILYAIILGQSRGALFGIAALLLVIGSHFVRSKVLVLTFVAIAGLVSYEVMDISTRTSGATFSIEEESAKGRLHAWHAGVNMAMASPMTGMGIGNFPDRLPTYSPVDTKLPLTAHSIWFLILGEVGWPGLVLLIAFMVSCFIAVTKNVRAFSLRPEDKLLRNLAIATQANLVAFMAAGTFLSYIYQWPIYVILIVIVALTRLANDPQLRR